MPPPAPPRYATALKRYYNDAKVIPPATTLSNGDVNASLLYRFNIDESDIVVIYKIMSLSDIALVLIDKYHYKSYR